MAALVRSATRLLLSSGPEQQQQQQSGPDGKAALQLRLELCRGLGEAAAAQARTLRAQPDSAALDGGARLRLVLNCL